MAITLAKMAANVATVSFQEGADTVHVTYHPGKITEKVFSELQDFSSTNASNLVANFTALNEILVSLIQSWDVFEDEAQEHMFPLDVARLSELPIPFRSAVLQAMMSDMRPNSAAPQATTLN